MPFETGWSPPRSPSRSPPRTRSASRPAKAGGPLEMVAANCLGAGLVASGFTVAFTAPNLLRKLFGEGVLSAAFIPLYAQSLKHESEDEANAFAAAGINLLCLVLLAVTLVG